MNCQKCNDELKSDIINSGFFGSIIFQLVCINEKCLFYGILRKDYRD